MADLRMANNGNERRGSWPASLCRDLQARRLVHLAACVVVAFATVMLLATVSASAQGWQWPWSQPEPPPRPREPVYRIPPDGPPPAPSGQGAWQQQRSSICVQLEQRLVQEGQRGGNSAQILAQLDQELREAARELDRARRRLDRGDCFDQFLFAKTLRRTRQCISLNNAEEAARRRYSDLQAEQQQLQSSQGRSYQDEIIRELARNNCGGAYQQEARRRSLDNPFASLWQDQDGSGAGGNNFSSLPFATYRTICVRLCDGYYFPVSFSTLPNHFQRDVDICQSRCAAPVELYFHANPGGSVEQALSVNGEQPYTALKSAFLYRKQFVQGCSCKQAEYVPSTETSTEQRAEAPQNAPSRLSPLR